MFTKKIFPVDVSFTKSLITYDVDAAQLPLNVPNSVVTDNSPELSKPKTLTDTDAKDDSGNLIKDSDGNQVVIKGLISKLVDEQKEIANYLLSKYDWYTLRAADGGSAVPSNIATYRAAVRTKANEHTTAIDAVSDVDALAALEYDWPTLGS